MLRNVIFDIENVLDFLANMDGGGFPYQVKTVKPEHEIYDILCEKYGLEAGRMLVHGRYA